MDQPDRPLGPWGCKLLQEAYGNVVRSWVGPKGEDYQIEGPKGCVEFTYEEWADIHRKIEARHLELHGQAPEPGTPVAAAPARAEITAREFVFFLLLAIFLAMIIGLFVAAKHSS